MVHRATASAIIEGRALEILSANLKGGLSVHQLRDRLNATRLIGASEAWFKRKAVKARAGQAQAQRQPCGRVVS